MLFSVALFIFESGRDRITVLKLLGVMLAFGIPLTVIVAAVAHSLEWFDTCARAYYYTRLLFILGCWSLRLFFGGFLLALGLSVAVGSSPLSRSSRGWLHAVVSPGLGTYLVSPAFINGHIEDDVALCVRAALLLVLVYPAICKFVMLCARSVLTSTSVFVLFCGPVRATFTSVICFIARVVSSCLLSNMCNPEPIRILFGLFCELAVFQAWRITAPMRQQATLALISSWIALYLNGQRPALITSVVQSIGICQMLQCFVQEGFVSSCREGVHCSDVLTVIVLLFVLAGMHCHYVEHQAAVALQDLRRNQTILRLRTLDLAGLAAASEEPPTWRKPSASTGRRLVQLQSTLLRRARAYHKRNAVGTSSCATLSPFALIQQLWSVNDAAALRTLLQDCVTLRRFQGFANTWYIQVERHHILDVVLGVFAKADIRHLLASKVQPMFVGEYGVDFGGVCRDFFASAAKEIVASDLFQVGPDMCLLPTPLPPESSLSTERLELYRGVGRFLSSALLRGHQVPVFLSHVVCKMLLGLKVNPSEVKDMDPQFFTNRIESVLRAIWPL
eukprot:TRINITY_DN1594_c0_g1_i2.p1 TRINITY_DN1594_c0_g1~~TRINITY_DN1594_c0_g1_i2.p1  ORF type:complete len:655 (-),score=57.27 TRINITY_DN1594_c0_g1_i2:1360-3042(-)